MKRKTYTSLAEVHNPYSSDSIAVHFTGKRLYNIQFSVTVHEGSSVNKLKPANR